MSKPKKPSEAVDRKRVAWHEAGHAVIADELGVEWEAYIQRVGPATLENKAYVGQIELRFAAKRPAATIGWGGIMAEYLLADAELDWRDFPELIYLPEFLGGPSATDARLIKRLRGYSNREKTAQEAARILTENRAKLKRIAGRLAKEGYCSGPVYI